eukprot:CAMPEP_0185768360 /NCGR_PEP_ID=MMETSP1174-20130828/49208_1 /TAXON_ID=35687 /ORGANISM="Dictyocha speculum, Strain CCMP1381" /LENGTH=265 /DNA_ID=CAMNT_0028453015 /DNA_START=38 /DNA_END=835 /DNA_ORIENTATION=-
MSGMKRNSMHLDSEPPIENDDTDHDEEVMISQRAALSRERNREHARRTRIRKKARLQALQGRVNELKQESELLDEFLEDCQTADILRSLSTNQHPPVNRRQPPDAHCKLKQEHGGSFQQVFDPRLHGLRKSGKGFSVESTSVGAHENNMNKCQVVHWKDAYAVDAEGKRHVLNDEEMETLRRERNRMHAKMTRDRRKLLVAHLEQTVVDLEMSNEAQRATINHCYGQIADRFEQKTRILHRKPPSARVPNMQLSRPSQQYSHMQG